MLDLATVSRAKLRDETMLQHPIYLYQVNLLGKKGPDEPLDDEQDEARAEFQDRFNANDWEWKTDRVFATYEEAKAYGESNRHNDGDENRGWRVWSVPAMGSLRTLLEKAMAP